MIIINNSTNISKTIQSLLIWTHWTQKDQGINYNVGNLGTGLGQIQKCGGVRPVKKKGYGVKF
jgi:hypothetical protein